MQFTRFLPLVLLPFFAACDPEPQAKPKGQIELTEAQKVKIGRKIWQNECGGTVTGLTTWNRGEEFPSLGIGHFIWYPASFKGRFRESWPQFVAYAKAQGSPPPAWTHGPCPWETKAAFERDFNGPRLSELRRWLMTHISLQTDFIIQRSLAALPKVLDAAPATERGRIEANYHKVASTPQGVYALIDYVNFKGDGTLESERYKGKGWGLMQVLGHMRSVPEGPAAAKEFADTAFRMLERRIENSPPERGEQRWRKGWRNRCMTYAQAL
ncbi:MAG: hypothetical protein R3242_07305 [Akkermansiaceae bacterium]|nr:hypothetical protein [Akkermansiaceae bacterium]